MQKSPMIDLFYEDDGIWGYTECYSDLQLVDSQI